VEDGERQARREARRRQLTRRRRTLAGLSLLLAITAVVAVVLATTGGRSSTPKRSTVAGAAKRRATRAHHAGTSRGVYPSTAAALGPATGKPGAERVAILMYHVINPPPPGAPFPGLYVPADEFAAQMQALAGAGYHAVTLDQMWAYWRRGARLPAGKPIVVSFDNGYQSQYTNALPVLRRLGWVGDENMQLSGLPPSQGGLSQRQIKGLVAAGWELDTQGFSHADLIALGPAQLAYQVATARQTIKRRYGVPVNWFCYPSGHYDPAVVAEVEAAGYAGSTTVVPGWAGPDSDPYRLPRLRVLGGTSPEALLSEIAAVRDDRPPPQSYPG
jgi:peptidoglycan/xylan/chitin deacetylase (PgdA/CDA1 family)